MIFPTHALFSLLICLILKLPLDFGLIFGATLPDIDYPYSYLGEMFPSISSWINKKHGHRSITHSVYWSLLFGGLCFVEPKILTLFIGYSSHILLDMFTYTGVKLFYPLNTSFTLFNGPVETGSKTDKVIAVIFAIFCIIAVVFSDYIPVLIK